MKRLSEELWTEVPSMYRKQGLKPSQGKRCARRQSGCLRRLYKELRKEEKQKAKEKRKDISTRTQNVK